MIDTDSHSQLEQTGKNNGRKLRVAVLMGGTSSEREVSLSTGRMIAASLDPLQYDVVAIDTRDLIQLSPPSKQIGGETGRQGDRETREKGQKLQEEGTEAGTNDLIPNPEPTTQNHPDLVFIALHGRGGEDGAVQGLLEVMRLPYTGSGILASALAMDKAMSKRLFRSAGIPVGAEITLRRDHSLSMETLIAQIEDALGGFPVFVKPNAEGSTVGGMLVSSAAQLADALANAFRYDAVILIEKYLRGMEATVGVLGNTGGELQVLPVIEIVPRSEFYDYESKYADGGSEHIIPARLTDAQTQQLQQTALRCHTLLGCRGMSRTDFIVTPEGPHVLEVNTIPGMTPTSLLPQAAAHVGISFPALLDRLIAFALE